MCIRDSLYSFENGEWRADRDYQNDAFVLHGGGGMKSTMGDMLKYAVMYLNEGTAENGNQIVDRDVYKRQIPTCIKNPLVMGSFCARR